MNLSKGTQDLVAAMIKKSNMSAGEKKATLRNFHSGEGLNPNKGRKAPAVERVEPAPKPRRPRIDDVSRLRSRNQILIETKHYAPEAFDGRSTGKDMSSEKAKYQQKLERKWKVEQRVGEPVKRPEPKPMVGRGSGKATLSELKQMFKDVNDEIVERKSFIDDLRMKDQSKGYELQIKNEIQERVQTLKLLNEKIKEADC